LFGCSGAVYICSPEADLLAEESWAENKILPILLSLGDHHGAIQTGVKNLETHMRK
jgi:hypothetical protein